MQIRVAREVHLEGIHCALRIRSHSSGVVVLTISGTDIGEFGERPMLELQECLAGLDPIHLFIDARDVRGASISVSGDWAGWLQSHKAQLRNISMLTGSRYVEVTADFVRRFAALESIMRIYTEAEPFDAALAESLA